MKNAPLYTVFEQHLDALPIAYQQQFLLTPEDEHDITLRGEMTKVYHPPLLSPLFWLLGKFGMLVPQQGEHIPTEVTLTATYDKLGNIAQLYNRKLNFNKSYKFDTIFTFDAKYQQPAEQLGPFGFLYMVWKTEFIPPYQFNFETMATGLKFGKLIIWFPKWLWKLLGTTYFEQTTSAENPNITDISLNIVSPISKRFFGYEGKFEVMKKTKSH